CASTGTLSCVAGVMVDSCATGSPTTEGPPGDATCQDGLDNDCDGVTDASDSGCALAAIDLDIAKFQVTKEVKLEKKKPAVIKIKLVIKNNGTLNSQTRPATVIGMQNGVQAFAQTKLVSAPVGKKSAFDFGPYAPTKTGKIIWTATIADDNPDVDTATAVTKVNRDDDHGSDRRH
ncbi:MAG: hypothetical protein AABZ36_02815, partial [Nitrospirota bacterium]